MMKIMNEEKTEKANTMNNELFSTRDSVVDWRDNIIEDFPRQTVCPICRKGKFQLSISGAAATGECDECKTSVPFQFYDTRYPYLDELNASAEKEIERLKEENKFLNETLVCFDIEILEDKSTKFKSSTMDKFLKRQNDTEIETLREQLKAREWVKVEDGLPTKTGWYYVAVLNSDSDNRSLPMWFSLNMNKFAYSVMNVEFAEECFDKIIAWREMPSPFAAIEAEEV